ncbi:MAG: ComEC/Rec2 family competence protein [Candidatus Nealsonbacteria bacterium]|nr:ComEC/Rec2 family competence protein [Candidatus Nealsonbacteria bacterium]
MISEKIKKLIPVLIGILFLANFLTWLAIFDFSQPQMLEVSFFDVGQGDSVFIETPQGHQILIDGGPDSTVLEKLGNEMPFWDRTIDLVILTHPDFDHVSGLIEILKSYKVENILWTGVISEGPEYQEWKTALGKENARVVMAQAGEKIIADGAVFEVLYPFESLEGQEPKSLNNSSIVMRLDFGEQSFLFTGDIYKSVENEILQEGENLKSDFLKVAHHGSKNSSAPKFIEKVSPKVAIIQVGKDNKYGHPATETLETLEEYGIKNIMRTDLEGDIKIISNGIDYQINN